MYKIPTKNKHVKIILQKLILLKLNKHKFNILYRNFTLKY